MPPKKAGAKTTSKILTLTEVLKAYDVESVQDLDDDLLLQIYRLKDSKRCYEDVPLYNTDDGAAHDHDPIEDFDTEPDRGVGTSEVQKVVRPAVHPYKACPNIWTNENEVAEPANGAPASSSKKRKSSEADDEGYSTSQAKGKGKARAVDGCTKDACKDNPRCLNWLGQEKWEDDKKAYEMFARQWGLGDNPLDDIRDPDVPVGLKNLGATCYANSFLQVWFQDETFRAGVYQYRPHGDVPLEKQSIFQLQVVFAALEQGNAKAFNPEALVKALELDQTEQQDAQEFAKLFMELLDRAFRRQPDNSRLVNLLSAQFEGTISYGTKCFGCKTKRSKTSTFRELEITLKNNKSLQELLEKTLAPEVLDGDNQYRCDRCNGLRDAERYTEILTLPPVLHFSLLRFVFDPETLDRRKSNGLINFPKSIDMGQYLPGDTEVWYDLKGVLLHRGGSAHSGHYTAHVYDAKHRDWFIFDDETVYQENIVKESKTKNNVSSKATKPASRDSGSRTVDKDAFYSSSSSKANVNKVRKEEITVISDSEDERNGKVPLVRATPGGSAYKPSTLGSGDDQRASKRRKPIDDSDDDREREIETIKSRDAYMLIYTRRGAHGQPNGMDVDMPVSAGISPHVKRKLQDIERAQAAAMTVYNEEEKECQTAFERMRIAKRSVYSCWEIEEKDETGYLVSAAELERWMVAEIDPPKKKKPTAASREQSDRARGSISTDDDDSVYVVSTPTVRSRTPTKPKSRPVMETKSSAAKNHIMEVDGSGEDEELPTLPGRLERSASARSAPDRARSSTAGASSSVSRAASASKQSEADGRKVGEDKQPEVQSSEKPTSQSVHGAVSVTQLDPSELLCRHDKVDPRYISKIKYISQRGLQALEDLGVTCLPKLPVLQSQCKECVVQPSLDRGYLMKHRRHLSEFKACAKDSDPGRWISKAWLAEWMKDKPPFHRDGAQDPSPESENYINDVFCTCADRRLQPDESKRQMITETATNYLRKHFPDWHPPCEGDNICSKCNRAFALARKAALKSTNLAKEEKKNEYLKLIISRASGLFKEHNKDYLPTQAGERCYAVPAAWLKDWREWLSEPSHLDRPGPIDLRPFFCEHQQLKVDLNFPGDKENLEIVSAKEWEELSAIYTSFGDLTISVEYANRNANRKVKQEPGICSGCRKSARSNFEQIRIKLYYLIDEDLDNNGRPKDCLFLNGSQPFVIDLSEDIVDETPAGKSGLRRSMRPSKKPGALDKKPPVKRRPVQQLTVKRLDTLRDIRVIIEKKTEIPILYQRVYFQGREIEDASETIESIGITDQETLFVQEITAYDDDVDISKLVDERPRQAKGTQNGDKKANNRAEGFGGTGLLGYSAIPTTAPEEAASIVTALPGTCTQCTYLNSTDLAFCEMCEHPL